MSTDSSHDTFPYKKYYLPSPKTYFARLCEKQDQLATLKIDPKTQQKSIATSDQSYEEVNVITDLFTEYARMRANVYGHASPYEFWKHRNNQQKVYREAKLLYNVLTPQTVRETLWKFAKETINCNVVLMTKIYNIFCPSSTSISSTRYHVLDPFSGWGDRAIAALACPQIETYTAVDSNELLIQGYQHISNELDTTGKLIWNCMTIEHFIQQKLKTNARDSKNDDKKDIKSDDMTDVKSNDTKDDNFKGYDLIFSSPPFFDFEIYSKNDPQQSIHHKKTYKEWLDQFWIPVLHGLVQLLKPGGHMVFYIGTTYRTKTMPEDTIAALAQIKFMTFVEKIDCHKNSFANKSIPIWVFSKKINN